ncbi:hypothetical protein RND81_02G042700 [Saponaria officinalis]|uniref:Late embryogenesis abundant protein LEA-2 subgroup domain-containing protein n=1 Tax=Saponaria officinalis TaxID=3572 RepID=A0AAW1MQV8_SAPOF
MKSTNLKLDLNCIFYEEKMKMKSYIIVTLFHGFNSSKFNKHIANIDSNGNTVLHFKGVDIERASIRIQVFNQRNFLPDKHVAKVDGRVSELVPLGAVGDRGMSQDGPAMFEIGTSFFKPKRRVLKLSYKLSIDEDDLIDVKDKSTMIGNDIGLFKTVPSFRTSLVSLNWN